MVFRFSPRIHAFLLHLLISLTIAVLVIALVFFIWYPTPLHNATGVTRIFLMLLGIDMILGPCLTLLVYKTGKKTLVMDITVIALLQLAALGYGLHSVADGRPAWLAFVKDRFDLIRVNEIDERRLDSAAPEYKHPGWSGPQWIAATTPADAADRQQRLLEAVLAGVDIGQMPDLYQPLSAQKDAIQARVLPLHELTLFNPANQVEPFLRQYPQADSWLPLKGTQQDMVVLMQRDSAVPVAIIDLRPW